jgi:hypothetical protein
MRSRFEFNPHGRVRKPLSPDHPAVTAGESLYPTRVYPASALDRILVPGESNPKIGGQWQRGWNGIRIFTLSLPERTTCPRTCVQWQNCYGNNQRWTVRVKPDQELIPRLDTELDLLATRFERLSVRLHNLGDFFSVEYAEFWIEQVRTRPGLHCFGFTARPRASRIGRVIEEASRGWDRFRIRFSGDPGERSAMVMDDPPPGQHDAGITCWAQTGEARKCESCGLCLTTRQPIVFKRH